MPTLNNVPIVGIAMCFIRKTRAFAGVSVKKSENIDSQEQTESGFNNCEHLSPYQAEENQNEVENREQLESSRIFKTDLQTASEDDFYKDLRDMIKEELSSTSTHTAQPFICKEAVVFNSLPSLPERKHVQKTTIIAQAFQEADVIRTFSLNHLDSKKEESHRQKQPDDRILDLACTAEITKFIVRKSKGKQTSGKLDLKAECVKHIAELEKIIANMPV